MEHLSDTAEKRQFEIFYAKKVLENLILLIRKDKMLRKKYEEFERKLERNPYGFAEAKREMPERTMIPESMRERFRYVELTGKACILYEICEQDDSVIIRLIHMGN